MKLRLTRAMEIEGKSHKAGAEIDVANAGINAATVQKWLQRGDAVPVGDGGAKAAPANRMRDGAGETSR